MSKRNVSFVIVCEDQQQEAFARRYLVKRGIHYRSIRVKRSPAGRGAGVHFVKTQLVQEIKTFRQKNYITSNAIVVMIDADTLSVDDRMQQINTHLKTNGLESVQQNENIAVFIPKRNIETWIYYAQGKPVDEETSYPKLQTPGCCRDAVDEFVNHICKDRVSADAPSSLNHACDELKKIL